MKELFIILMLFLCCCVSTDTVKSTGIIEIQFGSGGGFVGNSTIYTLDNNGKLTMMGTGINFTKRISKAQTKELYILANKLKFYYFNKPDNLYSFIDIKTNHSGNRIVWGFGSQNIDTNALKLFERLTALTK